MSVQRSRSLLRQTILIVLLAQVLSAALLAGASLLHEWHARVHAADTRLEGRSDSLLGAIQDAEDPDDNVTVDPAELTLPAEDLYAVYNGDGRLLGSSGPPPAASAAALLARHGDGFRNARFHGTGYRVYEREALRVIDRAENGGVGLRRPVTIVYASPDRHLWHEVFEAARFYLFSIVAATGLAVLLVAVLVRRALAPLAELAAAAGRLSLPSLDFAAPPSVVGVDELRPLAEVLEGAVGRLRESFAKEQRFVSDAAHELKTALAVLRSSVQLLMMRPRSQEEYGRGLAGVLEDSARVESLVAQMLLLAAAEQEPVQEPEQETAGDPPLCDLTALVTSTIAQLQPFAHVREVSLCFHPASPPGGAGPGTMARLFPDRGQVLLSNLIMNAIQHSPAGGEVLIELTGEGSGRVSLAIEDHGGGIAASALPHVFERFFREDRSRSRDTGGTGLGLSICRSIVLGAGGEIAIRSAPAQGTRVEVVLRQA